MTFMLSKERLESLLYKKHIVKKIIVNENVKDSLFWIFYKLYDVNYEKYPEFETESKIKFDLLSKYDKKKEIFKEYKLKKEDIENDLIYNKVISINGFTALCLYYNINVIITDNKSYFLIGVFNCKETKFPVLSYSNNNFNLLSNNLLFFDNYYKHVLLDKPLNVISKYKVSELKEIANIIGVIPEGNKKDLYEKLKNKLIPLINL